MALGLGRTLRVAVALLWGGRLGLVLGHVVVVPRRLLGRRRAAGLT